MIGEIVLCVVTAAGGYYGGRAHEAFLHTQSRVGRQEAALNPVGKPVAPKPLPAAKFVKTLAKKANRK